MMWLRDKYSEYVNFFFVVERAGYRSEISTEKSRRTTDKFERGYGWAGKGMDCQRLLMPIGACAWGGLCSGFDVKT